MPRGGYFEPRRFWHLVTRGGRLRSDHLLPGLFAVLSYLDLARMPTEVLGTDARIYYRAAAAFAAGSSPWDAFASSPRGDTFHFAALPPTVVAFLPFTFLPERVFVWLWVFVSIGAGAWIVRSLRLKWWWLFFPPLAEGMFVANPQIVLLALLLSGYSALAAFAPMLKIYALAPIVARLKAREIGATVAYLGISSLVVPGLWGEYLARSGAIAERLSAESYGGFSAIGGPLPLLLVAVAGIAALAFVDLEEAGWLVTPALVPSSQFHLSTMALPVLAGPAPVLFAIGMSIPTHGVPAAAIGVYGLWRAWRVVHARRLASSQTRQPREAHQSESP